ncbi:MAG TPA: lysophospholipid acyltransferase family protein [Terriglobales bacterium]|jgi:1-acyl-sn-glycerol-3-phosphate acyltransferase|nr:lysophospholipid acyltransferase family protein [Terriglobales bacterium]
MEDKTMWSGRPRPIGSEVEPAKPETERDHESHRPSRKYGLISHLRSYFVYDPLIWLYTIVFGITSIPFGFFDKDGSILHGFARNWSKLILKTIFSPVRITGLEKIDTSRTYVYAVNHASALDIPVLYASLPFQFRIVHKKELLSYPVIGWHLKRSGQVCVDQQNPSHSVGQIKSAVRTLKNGMPLVIFPEGGRTADGKIQPFLAGAFFMAIKANVDIVPIALVGTYELLPMDTFHIKSRPLEMRIGDPIPTSEWTVRNLQGLSAKVQQAIQALYTRTAPEMIKRS